MYRFKEDKRSYCIRSDEDENFAMDRSTDLLHTDSEAQSLYEVSADADEQTSRYVKKRSKHLDTDHVEQHHKNRAEGRDIKQVKKTERKSQIWSQRPAMFGIMGLSIVVLSRLQELNPILSHMKLGLVFMVISILLVISSKPSNHVPWTKIPQVMMLMFLVLWMPLTGFLGEWPSNSLASYFTYIRMILFYYLLVKSVYSVTDLRKLLLVILVSMLVFDLAILSHGSMDRPSSGGMTLDANDSALLIGIMTPFAYSFFRSCKGWIKYVALANIILGVAAVFATASRGGLITLMVALGYSFLADKGSLFKKVLLIVVAVSMLLLLMPSNMHERFSEMGDSKQDYNMSDKHGRMMIWGRAISIIKDNPVFGVGMGSFTFVDSAVNNQSKGLVSHNFVLQATSELGIPGGFCIVGMLIATWLQIRKIKRQKHMFMSKETMSILSALQVSIISFLLGAQFLALAYSSFVLFLVGSGTIVWKCNLQGDFDYHEEN